MTKNHQFRRVDLTLGSPLFSALCLREEGLFWNHKAKKRLPFNKIPGVYKSSFTAWACWECVRSKSAQRIYCLLIKGQWLMFLPLRGFDWTTTETKVGPQVTMIWNHYLLPLPVWSFREPPGKWKQYANHKVPECLGLSGEPFPDSDSQRRDGGQKRRGEEHVQITRALQAEQSPSPLFVPHGFWYTLPHTPPPSWANAWG